jgi:hypothetical protein
MTDFQNNHNNSNSANKNNDEDVAHDNKNEELDATVQKPRSEGESSAPSQPPPTMSTWLKKLRELLVRVGDKSTTPLEQNLQGLTQVLVDDLDTHIPTLVDFLFQCVLALPTKTAVYGTLVALLHFGALKNSKETLEDRPKTQRSEGDVEVTSAGGDVNAASRGSEERTPQSLGHAVVSRLLRELEDVLTALATSSPPATLNAITTPFGPLPRALHLKLLLRWLTELCNAHLIDPRAVLNLFIDVATHFLKDDGSTMSYSHAVAETVAYALLATIPFGGVTFLSACPEALHSLLAQLEEYITTVRQPLLPLHTQLLSVWDHTLTTAATLTTGHSPTDTPPTDYLSWLLRAVRVWCDARCPSLPLILQPWLSLDTHLSGPRVSLRPLRLPPLPPAIHHTATRLSVEEAEGTTAESRQTPPAFSMCPIMPLFRLFPLDVSTEIAVDKDSDTKRVLRDIERFVLEDYVLDFLFFWQDEHKTCVQFLLQLPVTALDLERALIEILFSQIFRLPNAPLKRVYYGLLLIDLCRARPDTVPTRLGVAITLIFEQLHILDPECFGHFVDWFSFHLSNFNFKWPWEIWKDELTSTTEQLDILVQQRLHRRAFIEEVILRLVRVSYHQRIAESLPTEFQSLLPPEPQPHFPFAAQTEAEELLARLRQREPPEQLRAWLEQENAGTGSSTRTELLVACLLHLGSKSLSHLINILDCYAPLLLNTPHQRLVLHRLWDYWGGHRGHGGSQQHLVMVLLKLLAYRVVTPYSIVEWLLSDEFLLANATNNSLIQSPMTQLYFWEIISRVLDRTIFTTQMLRAKLQEMSSSSASTEQNVVETEAIKEAYTVARKEQDSVFELTFRRLAELLQTNQDVPPYNFWYRMTLGHLKALGRRYYRLLTPLGSNLAPYYANVDSRIRDVFNQIIALTTNYS